MRVKRFLEYTEYRGDHTAPSTDDAPLHDLTVNGIYPDDFYDNPRMYAYSDSEIEIIPLVQSLKGKPNEKVKVYRAVPDNNRELNKEISKLSDIISYKNKWGFFPIGNEKVREIEEIIEKEDPRFDNNSDKFDYHLFIKEIYNRIESEIENLIKERQVDIKINPGDWVSISKEYAKDHGRGNLKNKYKLIQKTIPAKHLYTDGNSLVEFGYNP